MAQSMTTKGFRYVYLLESLSELGSFYTGMTGELGERLLRSTATSKCLIPWISWRCSPSTSPTRACK